MFECVCSWICGLVHLGQCVHLPECVFVWLCADVGQYVCVNLHTCTGECVYLSECVCVCVCRWGSVPLCESARVYRRVCVFVWLCVPSYTFPFTLLCPCTSCTSPEVKNLARSSDMCVSCCPGQSILSPMPLSAERPGLEVLDTPHQLTRLLSHHRSRALSREHPTCIRHSPGCHHAARRG